MWGQWLGKFDGTSNGEVILNIDKDRLNTGRLSTYDQTFNTPARWADIEFYHNHEDISAKFHYLGVAPKIENVTSPSSGTLKITKITNTEMEGNWSTNIGTHGNFYLTKPDDDLPSKADHTLTWDEFKYLLNNESQPLDLIFRGQKDNKWKLKTSLHRTGRFDLLRYGNEDVHTLNRYIASLINKIFNVNDPFEHGALLNLAQHHGFPTPLLDWTESAYIAAFFAFSDLPKIEDSKEYVRLFLFNRRDWLLDHSTTIDMLDTRKYFSVHNLIPLHNSRALPQQSVVTSTNISDIESWLDSIEPTHRKYLTKIDISKSERNKVMTELTKMGITSASLFPGVEGTCKALKEKYF